MAALLEMKNISKAFGVVRALNDASFKVGKGEIVALLGANGSGKSTLIKILGGAVNGDSGTIAIDGREVKMRGSDASRKFKIAVAYQELSLLPLMTVCENVMLGHFIKGKFGSVDEKANRAYVESLFKKYNITCGLDEYPSNLPPSVLSMIEIVKAISWKPDILLLDEVTATLHHTEVELLFENLRELAKAGASIVIVTHRLGEIYRVASRAVILRNGSSVADVNLAETSIDTIVYNMTGKLPETHHGIRSVECEGSDISLSVENLSISGYVHDASICIKKKEIVGLGGLEGQGQSQFLRALFGVIPYTAGKVIINGKQVKYNDAADAVRDGIGFISGDRTRESVFGQRSIGENIYSAKLAKRSDFSLISRRKVNRATAKIVDDYAIKIGNIDNPITSLSGGNQQKVVFGRWSFVEPSVLLLDDPTKGVDVATRREMHNFLQNSADKGMTVVMVSSDNNELLDVCDRIYVFFEGNIHAVLEGENKTEERFVSAMLGLKQADYEKGTDA
jgi:ABC-type sugar transport system ATPase subunit